MLVSDSHLLKVDFPMVAQAEPVAPPSNAKFVSAVQPLNVPSGIIVKLLGHVKFCSEVHPLKRLVPHEISAVPFGSVFEVDPLTLTAVRLVQFEKADMPI